MPSITSAPNCPEPPDFSTSPEPQIQCSSLRLQYPEALMEAPPAPDTSSIFPGGRSRTSILQRSTPATPGSTEPARITMAPAETPAEITPSICSRDLFSKLVAGIALLM